MKRIAAGLLCLCLLLSGCAYAAMNKQSEEGYQLYFREADLESAAGREALRPIPFTPEEKPDSVEKLAVLLVRALLKGPGEEEVKNCIPTGTALQSLSIQEGQATVDLSGAYANLSGVNLTLADYAITLTLTQLPEISSVKITVLGQELAYRDRQVFREEDVLRAPNQDVVGTVTVELYFPDGEGELKLERRRLELYEGDTQIQAVTQALEAGPHSKELLPLVPEGFRVKALWMEEGVCFVNLSPALLETLPAEREEAETVLQGFARSLCSLESVGEVALLQDGSYLGGFSESEF